MDKELLSRDKVKDLKQSFLKEYHKADTTQELEMVRVKYLGRKAFINELFSLIPNLSKEEKSFWGKELNMFKKEMVSLIDTKRRSLQGKEERLDLTFPAVSLKKGSRHILTSVMEKICTIFEKLGFCVIEGPEIEDEWHNFTALNIPLEHPSRDVFDTFYLDIPLKRSKKEGRYLLRSHTSPSQIRAMQKKRLPLAVVSPGRVYRPDEVDASHSFMFHQIEGFAVDRDINFSHLKGVLLYFARTFFSYEVELRFRPHFFPFTEPSAEVDISCIICKPQAKGGRGKGKIERCSVCKGKGWLEILGCGMIHPKVLKAAGINSKKYRGFAFGMGVERIAMLKYNINDIRLFYENDVRFLKQFSI
jgi:phenylalanyl-tRNA synthetase alpha chain